MSRFPPLKPLIQILSKKKKKIDFFHSFMVCLLSVGTELWFLIHRILKFQDFQLRIRINIKPNGKSNRNEANTEKSEVFVENSTFYKVLISLYCFLYRWCRHCVRERNLRYFEFGQIGSLWSWTDASRCWRHHTIG